MADADTCYVLTGEAASQPLDALARWLPDGRFRRILLKPNWVKHQEHEAFPIRALVTSTEVIDVVLQACLCKYPDAEEITVGDVPLQSCNWQELSRQAGIDRLAEKYARQAALKIRFLDLRRERFDTVGGFLQQSHAGEFGDPKGYREVLLDASSFLDSISQARDLFRVSDYTPEDTTSSHHRGFHRYLVAGSVLEADLIINLPKMKTHQKTGVTGALKNLVGINGQKAYLVHFRTGMSARGGDEFPPDVKRAIVLQTRVREVLQKRSRLLFNLLRPAWRLIKALYGIQTVGTRENLNKIFYTGGGSWFGNDTIWRMVYDLNKIVRYAPREGGELSATPQRTVVAIMDGIVAGEGNGPLQPIPVELGALLLARDPFLMDMVMAQLMGLDYRKVPLLNHAAAFNDPQWGGFNPETAIIDFNGQRLQGIRSLPVLHAFLAPPGWKGQIELHEPAPGKLALL